MRIAVAGATGTVGRHVVRDAADRGHHVVGLSRSSGHDLTQHAGVREALRGADAVVDVSSVATTDAARSVAFFRTVTDVLTHAEDLEGVPHHIALSIVGIDDIDAGYYAGKLAQEHGVRTSGRPWSILRAAQFHEFAQQVAPRGGLGPVTVIPAFLSRPVAACEVARRLVDLAEAGPGGRVPDLVGPADERVAAMVRRMFAHDGIRRPVVELPLPGRYWRGVRSGALRGGADADRGVIAFDEWLRSPDHTSLRRRHRTRSPTTSPD